MLFLDIPQINLFISDNSNQDIIYKFPNKNPKTSEVSKDINDNACFFITRLAILWALSSLRSWA